MDRFDPGYVCNHSDDGGRYDYQSQPSICRWNCLKLAEAIQGALPLSKAKQELEIFDQEFDRYIDCILPVSAPDQSKANQELEYVSRRFGRYFDGILPCPAADWDGMGWDGM